MAAMAGLLNHQLTAGQVPTGAAARPQASTPTGTNGTSGTSGSDSSDSSSSTISANDFLTLLVTEMQNQDPTADTDPNEYINQLVQVNSLEQLIDINQNLSTALGDSSTSTGSATPQTSSTGAPSATSAAVAHAQSGAIARKANALTAPQSAATGSATPSNYPAGSARSAIDKLSPGNLSVPDATPAALRVAQALNGRTHKPALQPATGAPSGPR